MVDLIHFEAYPWLALYVCLGVPGLWYLMGKFYESS